MTKLCFSFFMILFAGGPTWAVDQRAEILREEFNRLYAYVQTLRPDGKIGDFMKYKKLDGYQVQWDLAPAPEDYDLISLVNEKPQGQENFNVSFYRSRQIVEGRRVIRRFVGPTIKAWRNDTMDLDSGEYLGMQGVESPAMNSKDRRMLKRWNITLFE